MSRNLFGPSFFRSARTIYDEPIIVDTGGYIACMDDVRALRHACEWHLSNLSDEDITKSNAAADERQRELAVQRIEALRLEERKPKVRKIGFVYLMRNQRNGLTKIGFARNPEFREKTLQSEEPEINLLGKMQGYMADEEKLHLRYKRKRIRGEWFRLTEYDCKRILSLWA